MFKPHKDGGGLLSQVTTVFVKVNFGIVDFQMNNAIRSIKGME